MFLQINIENNYVFNLYLKHTLNRRVSNFKIKYTKVINEKVQN